jgi:L,D-transpeptidase YcbB
MRAALSVCIFLAHAAFTGAPRLAAQAPAATGSEDVVAVVRSALDSDTLEGGRWPRIGDVVPDLRRAYDSSGWTPLWLRGGRPTPQASEVVRYLVAIDSLGLRPADYDAALLDSLLAQLRSRGGSGAEAGRFEATLSVATARALAALQWGRISPRDVHEAFKVPRLDFDLAIAVGAAARAATPSLVFSGAQPRFRPYVLLKRQLLHYRALASDTTLTFLPPFKRLTEGDSYAGAPALRRLLTALGDLPAESPVPAAADDTMYTAELAQAIRSFQWRHGASADGIAGPATRGELVRPLRERVTQIELSLERWRWLPREFAGRVIMVNVPEFRLHAFDRLTSDSTSLFSMDVAVGDAYDHQTPIFMKEMEYLVFSPYWEVPTSIAVREIRPKAMRDPSYLARNRYVIVRGYSQRAPVVPPTPENIAQIGRALRVRQLPGASNSLGRVKFMLPNRHNIYLHDTPVQQAFSRFRRDVSHGCIRLADPRQLAGWLLQDQPEWTPERIDSTMARTEPLEVPLRERVPVLIVYGTAVAPLSGGIHFFPDIYRHDRSLAALVARGYPYSR